MTHENDVQIYGVDSDMTDTGPNEPKYVGDAEIIAEVKPLLDDIRTREIDALRRRTRNTEAFAEALKFITEHGHEEPAGEEVTELQVGATGALGQRAIKAKRLTTEPLPLAQLPDGTRQSLVVRTSRFGGFGQPQQPEQVSIIVIGQKGDKPPAERTLFTLGVKDSTNAYGDPIGTPHYREPLAIMRRLQTIAANRKTPQIPPQTK